MTSRVGGIILDGNKNLLIVFGKQSQKWGVPKGLREQNESHVDGALREIREETGLNLMPDSIDSLAYWGVNRARLYILQVDDVKPRLHPKDVSEIDDAIWLDLKDEDLVKEVETSANKMLVAVIKKLRGMV